VRYALERHGDLLVAGGVGVVAVAGQVVGLVVAVVRALECRPQVDIGRPGLRRDRLDGRVDVVGDGRRASTYI
jgi:hypothetical protein